jgi:hypothetical protein
VVSNVVGSRSRKWLELASATIKLSLCENGVLLRSLPR